MGSPNSAPPGSPTAPLSAESRNPGLFSFTQGLEPRSPGHSRGTRWPAEKSDVASISLSCCFPLPGWAHSGVRHAPILSHPNPNSWKFCLNAQAPTGPDTPANLALRPFSGESFDYFILPPLSPLIGWLGLFSGDVPRARSQSWHTWPFVHSAHTYGTSTTCCSKCGVYTSDGNKPKSSSLAERRFQYITRRV